MFISFGGVLFYEVLLVWLFFPLVGLVSCSVVGLLSFGGFNGLKFVFMVVVVGRCHWVVSCFNSLEFVFNSGIIGFNSMFCVL